MNADENSGVSPEMQREARESRGSQGLYRQEARHRLLTREEEEYYGYRVLFCGEWSSRNYLVKMNLRLVGSIAKSYVSFMPIEDLIQEGNLGLMRAADNFNPFFNCKFSTYATWWIRQYVLQSIADSSLIRIPQGLRQNINKMLRLERRVLQLYGRCPSEEEIEALGISQDHMQKMKQGRYIVHSLDMRLSDDPDGSDNNLHEILSDHRDTTAVTGGVENDDITLKLLDLLYDSEIPQNMQEKIREVIVRFFGLCGQEEQTIPEISEALKISRAKADSLYKAGMRFMQNNIHRLGLDVRTGMCL